MEHRERGIGGEREREREPHTCVEAYTRSLNKINDYFDFRHTLRNA